MQIINAYYWLCPARLALSDRALHPNGDSEDLPSRAGIRVSDRLPTV